METSRYIIFDVFIRIEKLPSYEELDNCCKDDSNIKTQRLKNELKNT